MKLLAGLLLMGGLLFVSCDSLDGGPRKIIINENVCADVQFLRMNLGEETEIVVDNTQHSDNQENLSLLLEEFPVTVTGDLPPNSQVGSDFTTLRLSAPAGEKTSVEVRPIYTGQFTGLCNLQVSDGSGGTILQQGLTFEIVDN
jgi:hypothetical protein